MKRDMTTGSVTVSLLYFVIPLAVGNVLQQLYNIIDTYIVGRYVGNLALSAVGSVSNLIFVFNAVVMGLKAGISVTCSEDFGRGDTKNFAKNRSAGLILILISTIICVVAGLSFLNPLLRIINVPDAIIDSAKEYLTIIIGGLPFVFAFNYGIAIIQAEGNSVITFISLLISTVCNVVLDLLFICVFSLGVKGAALATIIAQFISAIIAIAYLKRNNFRVIKESKGISKKNYVDILKVSFPSMLQQGILAIGIVSITALINKCGSDLIAGVAIGGKIDSIGSMPVMTIAEALSVYTAQNIGAGKKERIAKGIYSAMGLSFLFAIGLSILIFNEGRNIIQLFLATPNEAIVSEGMNYMVSILIMLIFMIPFRTFIGVLTGMRQMKLVIISFLFNIISRVSFANLTFAFLRKYSIYISNPLSVCVGAITATSLYFKYVKSKENLDGLRENNEEKNFSRQCSASGN